MMIIKLEILGLKQSSELDLKAEHLLISHFKKIPPINFNSVCWTELISLDDVSILREPPVTFDITDIEIKSI